MGTGKGQTGATSSFSFGLLGRAAFGARTMSQQFRNLESVVTTPSASRSPMLDRERMLDENFFVLSNYRRRFVLEYLDSNPGPVSLRTLSEELSAWENESDTQMITSTQRKRAYVSLRQTHLPKLEDLGIISFDANRGIVEARSGLESLVPFLPQGDEPEPFHRGLYIGLGVITTTLLGMAVAGIFLL